jgi:RNA-directed DNA polymerase
VHGLERQADRPLRHYRVKCRAKIYDVLRSAGSPEAVAHTITGVCTTVISQPAWRSIPVADDGPVHRRLGRRLAVAHLPQGAPTSPALATLVAFALDRRLTALADSYEGVYTRYVDDLIFSGPRLPGKHLLRAVADIAAEEGFRLASHKSVVLGRRGRQQVLGAVVNIRVSAPRPEIDRLRAILHNCATQGWQSQTRGTEPATLRAQLYGRIAWVNGLDPRRGAALRSMAERIDW